MVSLVVTLVVIGVLILTQRYVAPPAKVPIMVILVVFLALFLWRATGVSRLV